MNYISKLTLAAVVMITTGCSEEGTTVGPRGGVVVSDDGRFTLEIPEGALEQEVDITIEEVECEQPEAIDTCYEVDPDALDGLAPEDLTVLTEREEHWKPLADHRVDMTHAEVTASAVYLSSYAVVTIE